MASANFPIAEAQLWGLFMSAIFYGIYVVSFAACLKVLLFEVRAGGSANKTVMLIAAGLMCTFASLSLAFKMRHNLDAFIWYRGPGGANEELENISYWVNVMGTVCLSFQTFIGDLILIYRCFVVYGRKLLVVAFPFTIWVGTLVCGSIMIYITDHLKVSANIDEEQLFPFFTTLATLTLVQNMVTTSLIAFRIWSIDRSVAHFRTNPRRNSLKPVLRIIIESGAIYTVTQAMFLIIYLCSNNAQYPVADSLVQIIGIVFNMVIIRVHQGRTVEQEATTLTTHATSIGFSGRTALSSAQMTSDAGKSRTQTTTDNAYAMQPVQVNVVHQVERDNDFETPFSAKNENGDPKPWPVSEFGNV